MAATELQACGDKVSDSLETDIKEDKPCEDQTRLDLLEEFEDLKRFAAEDKQKILALEQRLKDQEDETAKLKAFNTKLIEENVDLKKRQGQNVSESQEVANLQKESEDLLTRAKGVIFEKTKVCKNQELQIEALTQQIVALKEVVAITKDLLDIRNMELKHLTEKLDCMDTKIKAEKDRHEIMHMKMDRMIEMNAQLKKEYETQLALFTMLKVKYHERDVAQQTVDELKAECEQDR